MKTTVQIQDGRISLVRDGEIIATNFDNRYPKVPRSFIEEGWHLGFPKEAEIKTSVHPISGDYIVINNKGEVIICK